MIRRALRRANRRFSVLMLAVLIMGVIGACGPATSDDPAPGEPPSQGSETNGEQADAPGELQDVTLRLDWVGAGYHAPFAAAAAMGFYEEEGLNVTIGEGRGSGTTTQLVANGADDFGLVSFDTAMQFISEGAPVRAVAVIAQRTPLAVVTRIEDNITDPKQLEGGSVAVVPGGTDSVMIGPFLEAAGVDADRVEIINVDSTAKYPSFREGRTDAILAWYPLEQPVWERDGVFVNVFWLADYGLNIPNIALIANTEMIEQQPERVGAFVRASLRGWEYALEHPQETIDHWTEMFPDADGEVGLAVLNNWFDLLHTERTQGKPIGWVAEEDLKEAEDALARYADLKPVEDVNLYYTNEFIPE